MFNKFEDYVQMPSAKNKLNIHTDGNKDYVSTLPEYYNKDCLAYGQKIKHKNGKKLFPALVRKVYGNPSLLDIDTNVNESFNSILRGKLSRMVRKTKNHSKNKRMLNSCLYLFQFYWNFMHKMPNSLTPAIMEKQATKVWTWGNFIHTKLSYI